MNIQDIENPIERFVAFIKEREAIRIRRASGEPWPWTQDDVLQHYRFTNIHREDDAVSQHYQKTVRNRYSNSPLVLPGTILYRWFNRTTTCDALFNEPKYYGNHTVFEEYIEKRDYAILSDCINNLPPPHVTGAFIITGKPGYPKAQGILRYFHEWCQTPWIDLYDSWKVSPPLLSEMYVWITAEGLGSFMKGQIVADLKYLPFMLNVRDWWFWATPGPGSMKGLNIVLGRNMHDRWPKDDWIVHLMRLSDTVAPMLEDAGLGKMHNQDLQNCLCEYSKYTKTIRGVGRPRQIFHHKEKQNV
jgi:hypothetical protein